MLQSPPESSQQASADAAAAPQTHPRNRRHSPWKRIVTSLVCLGLGGGVLYLGLTLIRHRLNHLTIDSGIINSRTVQLRAPIDGTIAAFYAQPGVPVKLGQVVAQITPTAIAPKPLAIDQVRQRFQPEITKLIARINQTEQGIVELRQQLNSVNNQDAAIQSTQTQVASTDLTAQQAEIDAAAARADAAKTEYQRLAKLAAEGAIAQQLVDKTKMTWEVAIAEVGRAKAKLAAARVNLVALQTAVPVRPNARLIDQQLALQRLIQKQSELAQALKAELVSKQQQLRQQTNPGVAEPANTAVKQIPIQAPLSGIVYRTDREVGEQINRPDLMLTIADCSNIWVEALLPVSQVQNIDATQPVKIFFAGQPAPQEGQVALIQTTTVEAIKQQSQAIVPMLPNAKQPQALVARVTVKIPELPTSATKGQFCGIGQSTRLTFRTKSNPIF